MTAFYNEIDPYAAAWLRNLIAAGHIAPGVVDERSIADLEPAELAGYTQCHFFAGIGVWSHALRLAGWPDDRPVWTGSCPCQPFSAAGKGKGHEDERHLWPAWQRLIRERRPAAVFGEQVASADGLGWLDVVLSDLEAADYAVAAADLSAAGFGAPHIRQRLFFVAHAGQEQRRQASECRAGEQGALERREGTVHDQQRGGAGLMADTGRPGDERRSGCRQAHGATRAGEPAIGVGHDANCEAIPNVSPAPLPFPCLAGDGGLSGIQRSGEHRLQPESGRTGFWSACDWLPCRDGKARPVEPGTFPLAHGAAARVGRLRAYGNAIVAPVAAEFIGAAMTPAERHSEGPSLLPGDPGQDEQEEKQ